MTIMIDMAIKINREIPGVRAVLEITIPTFIEWGCYCFDNQKTFTRAIGSSRLEISFNLI